MNGRSNRFLLTAVLIVLVALLARPWIERWFFSAGTPRPIEARGDLSDFEKTSIRVFEGVAPSVVQVVALPAGERVRSEGGASSGTGFVWDRAGHVVTNDHVVGNTRTVAVRLASGEVVRAETVGRAPHSDLVVLRLHDTTRLPAPVPLGEARSLRVGQVAYAIGNPFGLDQSLTQGLISALKRRLPTSDGREIPDVIQTDAAINPGNSGGPLFNMKGEVVGINSQIYSRSGGSIGVSFAIPIDLAMDVQGQLKNKGKVSRGRLGIGIQEVSKDLAESFNLGKPQGALVASVEKGAAADKAGIEVGDIILKFDGKPVAESGDLPRMVGSTKPGSKVVVQIWRKGASRDLTATVGEIPDDEGGMRSASRGGKPAEPQVSNRLGLVLVTPTAEQRRALGIQHGLIVEEVRNGGTRTDLRSGDIILSVIIKGVQSDVKSLPQFNELLQGVDKSATITLLVRRGDSQTFITIKGVSEK